MQASRRDVLKMAAAALVAGWADPASALAVDAGNSRAHKVVLVTCGGIRREESAADPTAHNLPHIAAELAPHAVFYERVYNAGVTSHFNTIASILTGHWQHVDDWGKLPPAHPTLFELLRKERGVAQDQAWYISSNKAMTSMIGASSAADYGARYGANVIFPKQLLINAVVQAANHGRALQSSERTSLEPELRAMLRADNYDGLGWQLEGSASTLDPAAEHMIAQAIRALIDTSDPATGDEFTYLVTREVMRRYAPDLITVSFSDMEAAHFGSYALYQAGIRTVDRLLAELWKTMQSIPAYAGKCTLIALPEFGRDADGSTTNGFFNHRQDAEGTRLTWMLALGEYVHTPQVITSTVEQTMIAPTVARMLTLENAHLPAQYLPGLIL